MGETVLKAFLRLIGLMLSATILPSCAVLHHVQVGELDNRGKLRKFDVKVSETGVNLDEARDVANALTRGRHSKALDDANAILSLFQMGPRTGNIVFNETYAENLVDLLYRECPSGRITGLTSIREMRKYPVISGEIVKVTGYCVESGRGE